MQFFSSGDFLIRDTPEPLLHNVDDGICDFWVNACYLFADSFLEVGASLGIIFMYSFL